MAVTIAETQLKKMTFDGQQVKKWVHDGAQVYTAEKALPNSSELQMGPGGYGPGANAATLNSSVKWDCQGFNMLAFTLTHSISGNAEGYDMDISVRSKSGAVIATPVNYYGVVPASPASVSIDISSLSEDEKSEMYLSAYMYAYCGNWTNKWATLYCVATDVIAS